jgi:VWFA-related protein
MMTLPRSFVLAGFFALSFGLAAAQDPTPTPLPYSESFSYKPRIFPAKKDKKNKEKEVAVSTGTDQSKQPPPEQMPGNGPAVIENSPISMPVSVLNARGNFVGDLKPNDFKVYIDGIESAVISVERKSEPLSVLLVLDTSPSSAKMFDDTKIVAQGLIDKFPANDKISVFQFCEVLKQLSPLTTDRQLLTKAISQLKEGDGTSIYDITNQLVTNFIEPLTGRTVVLLVTDGVDTSSTKSTYSRALVAAEMSGAAIYPVYLDTFGFMSARSSTRQTSWNDILQNIKDNPNVWLTRGKATKPGDSAEDYALGKLYLNDLVFLSGGRAVEANALLAGTSRVSVSIADEIHQQYYVTFLPVGTAFIGQRKHLSVRVDRPNLAVLTHGSYIVGSPPSKLAGH